MADEKILRPKSFRLDDDTADKFRAICESTGGNQQETLERLIQVYELQAGKAILTERKADMQKFEKYSAILTRMYMNSLEENQHVTDVVRESFEDALKSKDETIMDLQNRESKAEMDKSEAVNLAAAYKEEAANLNKQLEQLQKAYDSINANLLDKDQLNKALADTCRELRTKVESLEMDLDGLETLKRNLDEAKTAKAEIETKLEAEQVAHKKELEDIQAKMQLAQERAVLESEKKSQKEYEEQIRIITQKYMNLITEKFQINGKETGE